jgi:hypothetical protein
MRMNEAEKKTEMIAFLMKSMVCFFLRRANFAFTSF